MGKFPEETAQVTWARPPFSKFFGNEKGSIVGGPVKNEIFTNLKIWI